MGKKLSAKSSKSKKNHTSGGKALEKATIVVPPEPWHDDGTTKLLISFSDMEGTNHHFYTAALGGGEAVQLCCLPGCNKKNNTSLCTCYVSRPLNGLLCFHNGKEVSVCNPTTGDVMSLPRSSLDTNMGSNSFLNVPYSVYSFGFDSTKKEYKVLHVYGIRHGSNTSMLCDLQCEVFTLRVAKEGEAKEGEEAKGKRADLWRKTSNSLPCPYVFKSQGVCVNGAIHWIGMSSPVEEVIIAFDLATEKFRLLPISFTMPYRASLSEIRGRLAVHGVEQTDSAAFLGLWILEDYEGLVWNKTSVRIVDPKSQKGLKVHVLVGNDSTGDMLLTRKKSEGFNVIPFNGGEKTASKRKTTIDGLPSWIDLLHGANNVNFRIDNFEETRVWLEPIVEKVEEEKVDVEAQKASGGRRTRGQTKGDRSQPQASGARGPSSSPSHSPSPSPQNHTQGPVPPLSGRPQGAPYSYQDGFRGPSPGFHPQPPRDAFRGPPPTYRPQPRYVRPQPRSRTLGDFFC